MNLIDYIVIILFLAVLIGLGVFAKKKISNSSDYFVGGRKLGTFAIAALWCTSWIGGSSIIGTGSRSYEFGISGSWYVLAIAIGLIIFGLTFPILITRLGNKFNSYTYPDLMEVRYGPAARVISTVTTILAYIGQTAGQVVAAGTLLYIITGWSPGLCYLILAIVMTLYTALGGFMSMTYTNLFQFIVLILGVAVIGIPVSHGLMADRGLGLYSLPDSFFDMGAWGWPTIFATIVSVVFSFYTCMEDYSRCYSAKDERTSRNGALLAVIGVVIIAVSATYIGMAAQVLVPGLESGTESIYALALNVFPAGFRALLLIGVLAAILSTGNSCILTVSTCFSEDIYHRFINPNVDDKKLTRISTLVTFIVGILAALVGWFMQDVMDALLIAFTINSAGLFLPTVGMFWKKSNSKAMVISSSASLAVVLIWFIAGKLGAGGIFAIDALWPGFITSVVLYFPLCLLLKPSNKETERINGFLAAAGSKN